ncbi:MAG: homogentisate 1,2-dioxygenase, partial [Crocinitomicaceae bacterium]|nr:homogentisate 1,2-dioxygenase [Crocinitomicaceae bacterium]
MPFYHTLGKIPHKRHTVFERPEGGIFHEQLFGTEGFHGFSSLLYHHFPPTQVKSVSVAKDISPKPAVDKNISARMLKGMNVAPKADFLESREILLYNNDVNIACAAPTESLTKYFYKNADADEVIFIHKGSGTLKTLVGNIPFSYGDYLVIPRGIIFQMEFDSSDNRLFIVESFSPIVTPKRYRNDFGQLLEHSPFCERDMRAPSKLETYIEKGDFTIKIKKENHLHELVYASHPFDVVGWDGYNFP